MPHRAAPARLLILLLPALCLQGCIVATVVDTAVGVAATTVKVGAAVVGGTVKVAAAGVKAATSDDEDDKAEADKAAAEKARAEQEKTAATEKTGS